MGTWLPRVWACSGTSAAASRTPPDPDLHLGKSKERVRAGGHGPASHSPSAAGYGVSLPWTHRSQHLSRKTTGMRDGPWSSCPDRPHLLRHLRAFPRPRVTEPQAPRVRCIESLWRLWDPQEENDSLEDAAAGGADGNLLEIRLDGTTHTRALHSGSLLQGVGVRGHGKLGSRPEGWQGDQGPWTTGCLPRAEERPGPDREAQAPAARGAGSGSPGPWPCSRV